MTNRISRLKANHSIITGHLVFMYGEWRWVVDRKRGFYTKAKIEVVETDSKELDVMWSAMADSVVVLRTYQCKMEDCL